MSLIDGDERRLALRQHFRETADAKALGGNEKELEFAVQVVDADLAGGGTVATGMDALDGEAELAELRELVLHESDQRTDDQSGAAERDTGELVAEGLPCPGRHDEEDVLPLHDGTTDLFLIGPEVLKAEGLVEDVRKFFQRRGLGSDGYRFHRGGCSGDCFIALRADSSGRHRSSGQFGGRCCDRFTTFAGRRWQRADLANDTSNVVFNASDKGVELSLAPLDSLQIGFPLASHGGTADFRMDHFDEADAFVSGNQVSCLAGNVVALQQDFDDVGPRGRGAETVVLHGVGQFFFVKSLARCFHGG